MKPRDAVEMLLDNADILVVDGEQWMLIPIANVEQIDALAAFGAGAEDDEPEPLEDNADAEMAA